MNAIWKSRLPDKMKRLNGNYTRMLRAILNRYWKDHPNNTNIYGNIPDIFTSIRQQDCVFLGTVGDPNWNWHRIS